MPVASKVVPVPSKPAAAKPRPKGGSAVSRLSEMSFDDSGIKLSLYGRSGTGKTTLWGTFPGDTMAIICSGGKKPGEMRSLNTPENRKRIKTVIAEKSTDIAELASHQELSRKYTNVILDHASGLQDLILKEILGLDEIPEQKSWGMATQQQYGQCSLQCKTLMRKLLDLECNVVIVAQEKEFDSDDGGELIAPFVGSCLMPSVSIWLNSNVDYIGQTFIRPKTRDVPNAVDKKLPPTKVRIPGEYEYCLRTGVSDVFTTKFRVPKGRKLPELIVDPDYHKIMKVING